MKCLVVWGRAGSSGDHSLKFTLVIKGICHSWNQAKTLRDQRKIPSDSVNLGLSTVYSRGIDQPLLFDWTWKT